MIYFRFTYLDGRKIIRKIFKNMSITNKEFNKNTHNLEKVRLEMFDTQRLGGKPSDLVVHDNQALQVRSLQGS